MHITKTVQIAAPPELIWELLTDIEQMKQWTPSLVSDEPLSDGPAQVGHISKMKIKEGDKVVDYESEIASYEPTSHLGIVLRGGSLGKGPMFVDYHMSKNDAGITMHYESKWQPHGIALKLMSPIITKMAQRNATNAMNQLKTYAEQEAKIRQSV